MSRRMQAVALGCVTALWVLASPFITVVSLTAVMLSDAGVNDAVMAMIYIAWGWPPILLMAVVLIWVGFLSAGYASPGSPRRRRCSGWV